MFLGKCRNRLQALRARFVSSRVDDADDIDEDQLRAWSISAQLAAVPQSYVKEVPREVASLICAAKNLHPQMAAGAVDRERRGEPCPELGWGSFEGDSTP